jgi:hypothetical protein
VAGAQPKNLIEASDANSVSGTAPVSNEEEKQKESIR